MPPADTAEAASSTGSKRKASQLSLDAASIPHGSPEGNNSSASLKRLKQDGQKAISHDLDIALDEDVNERVVRGHNPRVYIDPEDIIWDANLSQSNINKNANKFYHIQLIVTGKGNSARYFTFNRWGRLGERGTAKTFAHASLDDAFKDFRTKFRSKTGHEWEHRDEPVKNGKYTFIQRDYDPEDDDDDIDDKAASQAAVGNSKQNLPSVPESKLPRQTQCLMKLIFNQADLDTALRHIGYNQNQLPLGKLSESTIRKGFQYLRELAMLIHDPKLAQNKYGVSHDVAILDQTNAFYSTIPHDFGRKAPPLIDCVERLRAETAMVDALIDMGFANEMMNMTERIKSLNLMDEQFKKLDLEELTPLDRKSVEFEELKEYLVNSAAGAHGIRYKLENIFRVRRRGEEDRFKKSKYASYADSCRRLLWHGSRSTNFAGILAQGLRIAPPEAPANGYMFGKGIYLADVSTKSANYCWTHQSKGQGMLLLCEAETGRNMYIPSNADYNAAANCRSAGVIATLGSGRSVPQGWVDAGRIHPNLSGVWMPDAKKPPTTNQHASVQYNEYICYDVEQVQIRYLFHFAT